MLFNSFQFAYFFAALLPTYWLLRKHHRVQNVLLLAAGYFFYACWNPKFLTLLVISTVMDYFCGIMVDRIETPSKRKSFVALSMALNLGMLGYFKYYNFFAESLQIALERAGLHVPLGATECRVADRHLVLHVSVDELRDRCLSKRHQTDARLHPVRDVRLVLPPPGRRADHAADDACCRKSRIQDGSTSTSSIMGRT